MAEKVYFYPHAYMRPRQLDTVRNWPKDEIYNPEILDSVKPSHVNKSQALSSKVKLSWKQRLPLVNFKFRPKGLSPDITMYVWGGMALTGRFIADLDNPYSLCGYNLKAFHLYRAFLKTVLESGRCVQIRCMSQACRESLRHYFGDRVYAKSILHYPAALSFGYAPIEPARKGCKFVFVGSQFELKGGPSFLKALAHVSKEVSGVEADLITYLPSSYSAMASEIPGLKVFEPSYGREEMIRRFFLGADVLVLPTFMESFGLVALEAISAGLAVISTDVYALPEVVHDGVNGELLTPPVSGWDGVLASNFQNDWSAFKALLPEVDKSDFEAQLESSMSRIAADPVYRDQLKMGSRRIFESIFMSKR